MRSLHYYSFSLLDPNLIKIEEFAKDLLKVIDVISPGKLFSTMFIVIIHLYKLTPLNTIRIQPLERTSVVLILFCCGF